MRNPYLDTTSLFAYVAPKLHTTLLRAIAEVPAYKNCGTGIDTKNSQILLSEFPILTKQKLQQQTSEFLSTKRGSNSGSWVKTSGSSGTPLALCMSRKSNALEFNYYWRYWGWSGYRLGDRFAELSTYSFLERPQQDHSYQKWCNRLLLNSATLSVKRGRTHWEELQRFQPRFIKGSPAALVTLAHCKEGLSTPKLPLAAIFTTGEILSPHNRETIENAFHSKVVDSYGQMERVAAISQCPNGSYHIHSDYSHVELLAHDSTAYSGLFKIIGTSLYNTDMPLIRYDTGDLVELDEASTCKCGINFPIVKRIIGRTVDVLKLPDDVTITAPYVLLDDIEGISSAQIVQENADTVQLLMCPIRDTASVRFDMALERLRSLCGDKVKVRHSFVSLEELIRSGSGKVNPVVRL